MRNIAQTSDKILRQSVELKKKAALNNNKNAVFLLCWTVFAWFYFDATKELNTSYELNQHQL